MLKEAKRLYDLGWGIHFIKPNSKAPVKPGWASGTRDDWATLKREYRKGYGLGVRLGEASKLKDGAYLANIDIDIKSDDPAHRKEALDFVRKEFPGLLKSAPIVKTGNGLRLFVKVGEPIRSGKLTASDDICTVYMPTSEINRQQEKAVAEGIMTAVQMKRGWRVRTAWEVEFMCVGKQVVLPPSIHPDTKKPYIWQRAIEGDIEIPTIRLDSVDRKRPRGRPQGTHGAPFTPVEVDLLSSRLSDKTVDMIMSGEGVDDRSAACFVVAMAMMRASYSDDEILSVLTDRETFLGETAYDHRKTSSRSVAAAWVRDYCLPKAREEVEATQAFSIEILPTPVMDAEAVAKQEKALFRGSGKPGTATKGTSWKYQLERGGKDGDGAPKPTLQNTLTVLINAVAPDVFKRDVFSRRESYGCDAPWTGGVKDKALTDDDAVNIKAWLAEHWSFEPNVSVIYEAMAVIATQNEFHPVRDELEALPEWDGVERIDTWLKRGFGAKGPDEFLAQVMRKWLVASITRTYRPGAKFDWMPVFEGKQGSGKSSFGAILMGQKYFADWLPALSDKDAALGLEGMRCVEFGELDSLRRNELETTKAFVTRQIDKVRPPYGRKLVELERQVVFFGTTNKETYFRDDSGNRRFVPVLVGQLDFELLRAERAQLWAEALVLFRNGWESSLYLEGEAGAYAVELQKEKMVDDESTFMVEALKKFVKEEKTKPASERFKLHKFKLVSLFGGVGPLGNWREDGRTIFFAAKALRLIGGQTTRSRGETFWKLDFEPPHTPRGAPTKKHTKKQVVRV